MTKLMYVAEYCFRYKDKAKLFKVPDKIVAAIRLLIYEIDIYTSDKWKYDAQLTDQKRFLPLADFVKKNVWLIETIAF